MNATINEIRSKIDDYISVRGRDWWSGCDRESQNEAIIIGQRDGTAAAIEHIEDMAASEVLATIALQGEREGERGELFARGGDIYCRMTDGTEEATNTSDRVATIPEAIEAIGAWDGSSDSDLRWTDAADV